MLLRPGYTNVLLINKQPAFKDMIYYALFAHKTHRQNGLGQEKAI